MSQICVMNANSPGMADLPVQGRSCSADGTNFNLVYYEKVDVYQLLCLNIIIAYYCSLKRLTATETAFTIYVEM